MSSAGCTQRVLTRLSTVYCLCLGAADEFAFHPPYADLGAISIGWQAIGRTYHSTADIESRLLGYPELSMWTRSLAFVIDQLENYTKDDLEKDGTPVPEVSTYQSISPKMTFGNF